jgi:hypothetical protein
MTPETFAHLTRITALRSQFSELRAELAATTDAEERKVVFDDALATLRRIKELEKEC